MALRVAINGFGRIGRAFMRAAMVRNDLEIVAINDLGEVDNLIYLLKYDSAYGAPPFEVVAKHVDWRTLLVADGKEIPVFKERDPSKLPWKDLNVDVVVESSGAFNGFEKSKPHLVAGAKRVVITAPVKDEPVGIRGATVLLGLNDDALKECDISATASCTTNAASPLIEILHETVGIEKALLNTVHAYTATQAIVDSPDAKDFRRGRAGAQNIVPSTTGAADAVTQVITSLRGKFDGIAMRVPVITGSIADVTFLAKRDTSVEEVNGILRQAAGDERWRKAFAVTDEPIVSSDIVGKPYASIADLALTKVVGGNLVKVCAWYDNEMGYVSALVEHVVITGSHIVR